MWPGLLPVVKEIALEERRVGGVHQRILCSVEEPSAPLLLHKPVDELPPGEGAFFLACNFWFIDNCILQGRHAEASSLFDRLLSRCNDVGLLAEQIDPLTGQMLGNFPQAYSHVGFDQLRAEYEPRDRAARGSAPNRRKPRSPARRPNRPRRLCDVQGTFARPPPLTSADPI
jgi:hypothetical protein